MVYKLVTQETVEEKILDLQERKRNLVVSIIEPEGESIRSMTRHDVESLFS
jgi:non-specific serine/threonine protein kinase